MFEKVFTEQGLRRLHKIGKRLNDKEVYLPSNEAKRKATEELERRLSGKGRVNESYSEKVLLGLHHANTHGNHGKTLLDAVNEGKKIYLDSYTLLPQ